jgi:hypothetical protein
MASLGNLALAATDPLLHEIDLPLRAAYHPLGFRLNLASNSRHAMEAAREAWGAGTPEFARQPLDIRIVVQPEGALADEPPVFRGQGELFSIVYDRHNFGMYDAASLSGYCFVSEKTAADHLRLRVHFLEAMTYALLALRHAVPIHAATVARSGAGFLLCGPSGSGKSTLAFACAGAGWTLISDDATWIPYDHEGRLAIGRPSYVRFREDAPRLFPELARYVAEQRPNGKITIEAPTADFPHLRTSPRCRADHLVLLHRRPGTGRLAAMPPSDVIGQLLADMPTYGERVWDRFQRTLSRLNSARAWRIEYETLEDALGLLAEIR